ncbi:MAG: hypothetical protein KJ726_11500 [Verrucomicrobia bacterium]|nr:hypothetical protein [Verrucomicrobiota bacterium]MBU1910663.1 hypothetical protein [Verrucomicrobiota bacterium]
MMHKHPWFIAITLVSLLAGLAIPARAGWPAQDQMQDVRKITEQLVGWANKLKSEYQGKWPGDQDFLNRADRFANRCQHLVNIVNMAIGKGENGRHTQSAYGSVRETWGSVNAASGAGNIAKWKERHQINKLLDQLAAYYQ